MHWRWIFLVAAVGLFSLLFWGFEIDSPKQRSLARLKKSSDLVAVRDPKLSMAFLADSLKRTVLTERQRTELASLSKNVSDTIMHYAALHNFWQKVGGVAIVLAHYYLGEKALLQNNLRDLHKVGVFFVNLLDMTSQDEIKKFFVQMARTYLLRAKVLNEKNPRSFRDSLQIALAVIDLYGNQPMQGVGILKSYVMRDTSIFAIKFLSAAYLKIGKNQEAMSILDLATRKAPQEMVLVLRLAEAYEKLNKKQLARQVYENLWRNWRGVLPPEISQILQQKIHTLS